MKVVCHDLEKAGLLKEEANELAKYWGGIDTAGISSRPCPQCGDEVHVFVLSYEKVPVANFVSISERYSGEADDFFVKERIEHPFVLFCHSCGICGQSWEEMEGGEGVE